MLQNNYTSNTTKIVFNADRVDEIKRGIFRPISMHFAITDKCNLNCEFCSNKKRDGNEFSFPEIKNILNVFRTLGLKSVEFTGGEPTLHPNINEIVEYAHGIGIRCAIKSNGVSLMDHLTDDTIGKLSWLRVSLNCLDYVNEKSWISRISIDLQLSDFRMWYTTKPITKCSKRFYISKKNTTQGMSESFRTIRSPSKNPWR